jgi:hypothetical protein
MKKRFGNASWYILALALVVGCSSSPGGPGAISSRNSTPSSSCTTQCHNSRISPDPLVTNGTGTYGKHVAHVVNTGLSCEKCHYQYVNSARHMNGTLDTGSPSIRIVYFDATNPSGAWINDTGPSTGSCRSLNCHGISNTVDWYGPGFGGLTQCSLCHSSSMGSRRQVTDAGGDFGTSASIVSHHVTTTGNPTREQCLVCHYQSTHTSGTVRLRHADTNASIVYNPAAPVSLEPFCLSCHDENGATSSFVSGGTPTNPFNDGSVLGNTPYPYARRIASSWAKSYGHGPNGNHASGSRLTCMGTGAAGTGCHGNSGRINAHGSSSQVLAAREFKYDIASSGTYTYDENHFNLCFSCHAGYGNVTKERTLGVRFGGMLDTGYGGSWGPRGWNPPYDTGGAFLTRFADHNIASDPSFILNDYGIWGPPDANRHWFHLGLRMASFRGPGNCMSNVNCSGITCVNCHDVHGSNIQYGGVYDELAYTNTTTAGNIYSQMTLSAYYDYPGNLNYLSNYPTYCSFNCHHVQGETRAWYYPITE